MTQGNPLQFNFLIQISLRIIKWRRQRPNTSSNLGYTCIYILCCWKIWRTCHSRSVLMKQQLHRSRSSTTGNLLIKPGEKSSYQGLYLWVIAKRLICLIISSNLWRILRWTQTSWSVLAWMGPTSTNPLNENLRKNWRKTGNSFLSWLLWITYCEQWFLGMFETIKGNTGGRTTFDFFFKYSSARREDCKEMENLTDITAEYLLKYCLTCWLCIGKVVVWVMEPMENIKEYFLTFLPALKGFMNKNGVGSTERYQRIKKALNNDLLFPTLSFIVYTSNIFKPLLFQSKQPLIYILHIWMKKLVGDLLFKFYSIKSLSNIGGSDRLLKISELIKFNEYAKKKYNTQREVGSKTKELLASIDTLEKKKFKEGPVTSFYAVCQILAS